MQNTRHEAIIEAFIAHSAKTAELGSPFLSRVCRLFAERLEPEAKLGQWLASVPSDIDLTLAAYPLRVCGALHALVLSNASSELEPFFPPHTEGVGDDDLWRAIDHAMSEHWHFIRSRLPNPPQTNEVRRAAIFLPGFLIISQLFGLPFKLSEIGASAGLNLCWDRFRYRLGPYSWGDPDSSVFLEPDWAGTDPPDAMDIEIAERSGCDQAPLDPNNPDDCLKLLSFVWADQPERIARLSAAIQIATSSGVRVEKSDAVAWLSQRLREPAEGMTHVVYHSSVWMYFDSESHKKGKALMEEAGNAATPNRPLAWLKFEPDEDSPGGGLVLQVWPPGETQTIARADFHGRWVNWSGWKI